MIKCINGWWYVTGIGSFYMYNFPTRADAEEALRALKEDRYGLDESL